MTATHLDNVKRAFDLLISSNPEAFAKGIKVLDAGCRDDGLSQYFEDKGFLWHGIDAYPASQNVREGNFEKMPCVTSAFAIVFCSHAIEHCENPVQALREFHRVLGKNGLLFMATPWPCKAQVEDGDQDHPFVLSPQQWAKLLNYVGFRDIMCTVQTEGIEKEQDYNVICLGRKR